MIMLLPVSRPETASTELATDAGAEAAWAVARSVWPPGPRYRPKVTPKALLAAATEPRTAMYAPAGLVSLTAVTVRPAEVSHARTAATSLAVGANRAAISPGVRYRW